MTHSGSPPGPTSRPTQLTLGMKLSDETRFANFAVCEGNRQLLQLLAAHDFSEPQLYIRAARDAGLTHVLQAVCHARAEAGRTAFYLPLAEREQLTPDILEGIESLSLISLDDIDAIAGDLEWERAVFNAFNAASQSGTQLLFGASSAISELAFALPDLKSRLQLAPVYQLQALPDADRKAALQMRAGHRGMKLGDKEADYLLSRGERSMTALMTMLATLETSSLNQRRALTIPFIRETLGW